MLPCYDCKHKRSIPGDAHLACAKPCTNIKGNPHGIRNGWFMYPINFDPVWGDGCKNFESTVNPAVSNAVIPPNA